MREVGRIAGKLMTIKATNALVQSDSNSCIEKWLDSGYISKVRVT